MSACEHCWAQAQLKGVSYSQQVAYAEANGLPCTQDTLAGRKLRAGQFWDEALQLDLRESRRPDDGGVR